MVISGLIIHTKTDMADAIARQLVKYPGVEIHSVLENCKIVVVLESPNVDDAHELTSRKFASIEGVLGVYLTYCNFEEQFATGEVQVDGSLPH